MTDTVNVPREVLERIAAADFEGVFCYEENPQYEGANTSGHIIRYRPRQQPPAPDGSRSVKLSFPVLAAASWLDDVESVLPVFAEFLTYAPALAKDMLAAAPKAEPVTLEGLEFFTPEEQIDWLMRDRAGVIAERNHAEAEIVRLQALIDTHPAPSRELLEAADFLADRVTDHEHSLEADDFYGHVLPALARYRLAKHKGPQS